MTVTVQLRDSVSRGEHVVSRDLGGESVLLNLDSGQYYGLDEVGGRIWSLLAECQQLRIVHQQLVQEYDVEPAEAERDLLRIVRELNEHGLVQICHT